MPSGFDNARPLAFMHVPKCAGSSLIAGLYDAVRPAGSASGFDRVLFGAFDGFDSFSQPTRDAIFLSPVALPDASLVTGHIALSTLRARYPDAQIMTLLREPHARLLSHWLFWRGHDDSRLADWGDWAHRVRLARLPLAAFLNARVLACQNDNVLVRMLLWPHRLIPLDDFIDERNDGRLLAEARDALKSLDFVGVVEDAGLESGLQAWLGRPFAVRRHNATAAVAPPLQGRLDAELTPGAFDRLDRLSRVDAALWSDVAARGQPDDARHRLRQRAFAVSVAHHAMLLAGVTAPVTLRNGTKGGL